MPNATTTTAKMEAKIVRHGMGWLADDDRCGTPATYPGRNSTYPPPQFPHAL